MLPRRIEWRGEPAVFSPNGKTVATESADYTMRVWDVLTGRELFKFEEAEISVNDASYSHDGKLLIMAAGTLAKVIDVTTGALVSTLKGSCPPGSDGMMGDVVMERCEMRSVAFSPGGNLIVTTASREKVARIWNPITGREVAALAGHEDSVRSAVFSPNGMLILTASDDGTVRLWDVRSAQALGIVAKNCRQGNYLALPSMAPCEATANSFSSDGRKVITASDNGAYIWEVPTTLQELIATAKTRSPRCPTAEQRAQNFLDPDAPSWCRQLGKWSGESPP